MKKLADAARAAFTQVRAAHPKERFYVFALFSADGDLWEPSANTEERLGERDRWFAEEFGITKRARSISPERRRRR
jgi:hypothetical protein